jgi:hypothetical protein
VSTGYQAGSGKLAPPDVARSPVEAQFQLVFGTQTNRNGKPQGLEVAEVFTSEMAVALVHAPAERGHAGGFGQEQAGLLKRERR